MSRILVKLADYEQMGITNIFVVEPTSDSQYFYSKGCLERMRQPIVAGRCRIDFAEIKKNLE